MRKKLTRMPSPAMAVAFVALLAALTGTAVALPGNNTVTSGDIVAGGVTTSDIRNNTVRGRDVRNNTLTGSDVNEGSLGTVPRANTANTATAAGIAGRAGSAASVDTQRHVGPLRLSEGQSRVLDSRAPFTLTAYCDDDPGTVIEARIELTTSQNNTAAVTDWDTDDPDFDTGDDLQISNASSAAVGTPDFNGWYSGWMAVSADGNTRYQGHRAYTGARTFGSDCYIGAYPFF